MLVYNVHTPSKTFALASKDGEGYDQLIDRVCSKGGIGQDDVAAVKARKDGAGLVYEHEGSRWALEDDGDLAIFQSRFPASSTQSATLHLTGPHPRAHFALEPPVETKRPTASSALKKKVQSKSGTSPEKSQQQQQQQSRATSNGQFVHTIHGNFVDATGDIMPRPRNIASIAPELPDYEHEFAKYEKTIGHTADGAVISKPKSIMSTRSRKSKWGEEDPEPWWDIHRQRWMDFHANNGVRTVVGKAGGVDNVRMLLKPGYSKVYVSRSFAIKHGLVHDKYSMGAAGYTGIKILGPISITVGSRTAEHQAMINEEQHFDVVLGRLWVEKMAVKVDPLDQTSLTYMDSGEVIPCDLVVLKDPQGNLITIT
ncbi:hypothetical protein BD324DRAFT_662036 [Kockovaella imperatae]|uniref:Uncharacterized protein n=1 Tax=Kockovaella imperatae TaxID=4999 RepID=A0A1Y1UA75_9TREE|nr:hypothetical protein BD324DRAFT_662036 [Kockovaella imperatae]ORX34933.1 hypothetical protein BD324DRAFT_662036 [Kockovaella imperatae]